jgi:ribosomal protein S12 methylthiotransferase accessory factor
MIQTGSGLRVVALDQTLAAARRVAPTVGITRVTDTTRLDRVGIPVFASIRPDAEVLSLCVSAGKGLRPEEAQVGAYMEAIELAFAEVRRARVEIFPATPLDVLDGATRRDAIVDFVPAPDAVIDPRATIDCAHAVDLRSGAPVVVPAEKVVFPLTRPRHGRRLYFASDGNGIASGNTIEEATVHGLAEVIERDVHSFHNATDRSRLIYTAALAGSVAATATVAGAPLADQLPPPISAIVSRLDELGFDLWLRYLPSGFDLPTVQAVLRERGVPLVHFGYGCHPFAAIALVRAVSEAAQSRLSLIHGGRDDLLSLQAPFNRAAAAHRQDQHALQVARAASERHGVVNFGELPDHAGAVADLPAAQALLLAQLAANGLPWALRVALGPDDLPLKVVRVLVPGCELYAHGLSRIGRRLARHLRATRGPAARPETAPDESAR